MRRSLTLLASIVILTGLIAAPAAADPPTVFGPFEFSFDGVDPCTGEDHEGTLSFTVYSHEDHANNLVGRVETTGTTDSGYVLVGGYNHFQDNENVVTTGLKEVWRNPDTGAMMQTTERFRIAGNSMIVDTFEVRCVRAA